MTHKQKTLILQLLAKLPENIGNFVYHQLQSKSEASHVEKKIRSTEGSFSLATRILAKNGLSLKNKIVVEIGSGWVPIFPYLMIIQGQVKAVRTYDINEHYSNSQIKKVNEYYSSYENFNLQKNIKYSLLENVSYYPKQNVINSNLDDVDLIFSRFVLEHVPPKILVEMHSMFAKNLKSGTHILHLISPSDHRAYTDSSLSLQDFLKYSEEEWIKIQTKFDYHNRLRLPQYIAIFEEHFDIVYIEHDLIKEDSIGYKKFKELTVHKDYSIYSDQELMAGSINVLLRKR